MTAICRCILAALLLSIPVLSLWLYLFKGWVFDDAYIAFRFSDNWASGHGLTWNPGEDPVEGFTSFAWVLIGALLQRVIGIPPHTSMFFVGLASWVALLGLILPAVIRMVTSSQQIHEDSASRVAPAATFLGLLLNPFVGFAAFHGLETSLHMGVFTLAVYLALKPASFGTETGLLLASILSFMIRPDAVAFIIPLWTIVFAFSESRDQRSRIIAGFSVLLVTLGIYSGLKWWWFGYPLPNTFYVKQGGLLSGLEYVRAYVLVLTPVWLFLAFAAGRAGLSALLRDKTFVVLVVPAAVFCLAYVKLDPTLGQGYRFLIPTLPMMVLASLRAYSLADTHGASSMGGTPKGRRNLTEACAVYLLMTCSLSIVFGVQTYRYYHDWHLYFSWIERTLVRAGQDLAKASVLSPPPLVATGDAGAIPYFSRLPTVDTIGLADETVTHHGLTHDYLAKRNPDLLVLQDLYLSSVPQAGHSRTGDCSGVDIEVDGVLWTLDLAKYRGKGVCRAPERAHSGAGSTFQIVTAPAFTTKYTHVTQLDPLGEDRYYVFVRRDYAHFEQLVKILKQARWNDVPPQEVR